MPEVMSEFKLGACDLKNYAMKEVRPLTEDEVHKLQEHKSTYATVNSVMDMFRVLELNHQDLLAYMNKVSSSPRLTNDAPLHANRLIFNYLASADATLEHISRFYKRQCRLRDIDDKGFDALKENLCKENDSFQFFALFRNYVLHNGLPVGELKEAISMEKGKALSVTYEAKLLLTLDTGRKDWSKCRLLTKEPTIDLLTHIEIFNATLVGCIFGKVTSCCMKNLEKAQEFSKVVTAEVRLIFPNLTPCVILAHIEGDGKFSTTFEPIPADVFGSLGIQVK